MYTNYSIIIVDDDVNDQNLISIFFKKVNPDITVNVVNNGEELLQYLGKCTKVSGFPKFIITDINMPYVGGIEAIKKVKQDSVFVDIPIYVLTSCADFKTKVKSMILGASGYYQKPFNSSELKSIFEKILEQEGLLVKIA